MAGLGVSLSDIWSTFLSGLSLLVVGETALF
jgi:hypothetical protein